MTQQIPVILELALGKKGKGNKTKRADELNSFAISLLEEVHPMAKSCYSVSEFIVRLEQHQKLHPGEKFCNLCKKK